MLKQNCTRTGKVWLLGACYTVSTTCHTRQRIDDTFNPMTLQGAIVKCFDVKLLDKYRHSTE